MACQLFGIHQHVGRREKSVGKCQGSNGPHVGVGRSSLRVSALKLSPVTRPTDKHVKGYGQRVPGQLRELNQKGLVIYQGACLLELIQPLRS